MGTLTRRYSERLGVLTDEQLQAAAVRLDLGRVLGAEPAPGGLFGQNVFLSCERGDFVLRGHPHGHWQLTKERAVARRIHEDTDLDAPWPYEICDDPSIFGWTFSVAPRLSGRSLDDDQIRALQADERTRYASELGRGVARLHGSTSPRLATYDDDSARFVAFDGDLRAFVGRQLDRWRGWAARTPGCLTPDDDAWIDALVTDAAQELSSPCQPVLVHHDYKPNNVLVDEAGRVTGIVDLMEAFYGDGDQDLVRSMCAFGSAEREAFLDGYTSLCPLREGAAHRIAVYTAIDRLVLWEYGRRNDLWFRAEETFRAFAAPFVEQLAALVRSRPLVRPAVRLLIVTPDGSVLLQRFSSGGASWWVCPGGGIDPGEDVLAAAVREAREELGLELDASDLGPEIWTRRHTFAWRHTTLDQRERFFLFALAERFEPVPGIGAERLRAEGVVEQRWWTLPEIEAEGRDRFAPPDIAVRVRSLLADGPPPEPVEVGA